MGATASVHVQVVNKAVYDIHVGLYKPKDVEGMSIIKQYCLLPGETKAIKVGKGANIRISGEFLPVILWRACNLMFTPNPEVLILILHAQAMAKRKECEL